MADLPSIAEIEKALAKAPVAESFLSDARRIHMEWADWQTATPDWRDRTEPDSPGGPEHHREWVGQYDTIIGVLSCLARVAELALPFLRGVQLIDRAAADAVPGLE